MRKRGCSPRAFFTFFSSNLFTHCLTAGHRIVTGGLNRKVGRYPFFLFVEHVYSMTQEDKRIVALLLSVPVGFRNKLQISTAVYEKHTYRIISCLWGCSACFEDSELSIFPSSERKMFSRTRSPPLNHSIMILCEITFYSDSIETLPWKCK